MTVATRQVATWLVTTWPVAKRSRRPYQCERQSLGLIFSVGPNPYEWWDHVITSQNEGSTNYISPFRLRVLQLSRHLFSYWNK